MLLPWPGGGGGPPGGIGGGGGGPLALPGCPERWDSAGLTAPLGGRLPPGPPGPALVGVFLPEAVGDGCPNPGFCERVCDADRGVPKPSLVRGLRAPGGGGGGSHGF